MHLWGWTVEPRKPRPSGFGPIRPEPDLCSDEPDWWLLALAVLVIGVATAVVAYFLIGAFGFHLRTTCAGL
jgi:hypothetical protein